MSERSDLTRRIADLLDEHRAHGQAAQLRAALGRLARSATPDAVVMAAEAWRDEPEVIVPLYDAVVEAQPSNARAMVVLANALWLVGAGPQAVEDLASRALALDEGNRGAWHLWSLAESDPRARTRRWRQVCERFPDDDLALANIADNAAAIAGAEQDYEMLDLAVASYEVLMQRSTEPAQRSAVETALRALKGWRF